MTTPTKKPPYPAVAQGTSMVDRINLSMQARRYLKKVGGRWWLLVLCSLAGLGVNSYRAFQTPNQYQATSIISIPQKVGVRETKAQILEMMDKFYENRLAEIRNYMVLDRTRKQVNKIYPKPVTPSHVPSAELTTAGSFKLVVTSTDFLYAYLFSTNWAHEVIRFKEEKRSRLFAKTGFATEAQINRERENLKRVIEKMQQFRMDHNIGSAAETGANDRRKLEQLISERDQVAKERELLEQTTAQKIAEGALGNFAVPSKPPTGAVTPAAILPGANPLPTSDPLDRFVDSSKYQELTLQLLGKKAELDRVKPVIKPKHPFMMQIEGAITQLEERVKFEIESIERSKKVRLESLISQEKSYEAVIDNQRKKVIESGKIQDEYNDLQSQETSQRALIETLDKNLASIDRSKDPEEEYDITALGEGSSETPSWGNQQRRKMILMGFLSGLAIGIGIAYFLQRLDDRLELAEEIETELGEPILGQVPQVDPASNRDGFLLITKLSQHNMFSESIRGVRSAVMLGAGEGVKQFLLVTSAVPGDGKTTFTVNFAATLAIAGHKVLLIDADLRRGNVHFYFSVERDQGMSEILAGESHWTDVIKSTEVQSLKIITSGKLPPNPGELLISPITKEFFTEARKDFDYVIVDCPPLTAIDDTFSLANMADGLLFVVRAGQTSMKFAKTALQAVRHRGARIVGIVLNGITADNPYYYYNSYYHAYYNKEQMDQTPLGQVSVPRPGSKMAPPKRGYWKSGSIESIAKQRAGEGISRRAMWASEAAKTQEFKARREVQKKVVTRPAPSAADSSERAETNPANPGSEEGAGRGG